MKEKSRAKKCYKTKQNSRDKKKILNLFGSCFLSMKEKHLVVDMRSLGCFCEKKRIKGLLHEAEPCTWPDHTMGVFLVTTTITIIYINRGYSVNSC